MYIKYLKIEEYVNKMYLNSGYIKYVLYMNEIVYFYDSNYYQKISLFWFYVCYIFWIFVGVFFVIDF